MTRAKRTIRERIIDADERGARWLSEANLAAERGNREKAERLYEKGQRWMDVSNRLRGNGGGGR